MIATPVNCAPISRGCTCGCAEPHRIGRRTTADGAIMLLWSDGQITDRAARIYGTFPLKTMWAAFDLLGFYDVAEVRLFVREWKRAIKLVGANPTTARAETFHRLAAL